jgi:hypothetical protein
VAKKKGAAIKITTGAIDNNDPHNSSYVFLVKTTRFDEKSCNLVNLFNDSFNDFLNPTNGKMDRPSYLGDKYFKEMH